LKLNLECTLQNFENEEHKQSSLVEFLVKYVCRYVCMCGI
jgi:hypothetical protein